MNRIETEKKKELARALYLSGMDQKEVAEKVGASPASVSSWCVQGHWREERGAKTITRAELVNKLLNAIDQLITRANETGNPALMLSISGQLSKFASTIEKLDNRASVVDAIDVFMGFSKWLEYRSQTDPGITAELMRQINRLQDMYITEQIGINNR